LEPAGGASGPNLVTDAEAAEQNPVLEKLRAWDSNAVSQVIEFRGQVALVVPKDQLRRVAQYLQTEPGLEFNFLSDISVVDRLPAEPRFELNYQLLSITNRRTLCLRVWLSGMSDPVIDSMTPIYPTANWHERENYDLFGVRFEGHPDLRRILMPDDWEGFPLRKDYPVEGFR
jgi:NADH-quinone oxidoreductase subunit C